jgi:DNA-binding CsgD family transcriptional regulator
MLVTTMQNLQFIVGFDTSARFVHLFHAETAALPINCDQLVGQPLGKYTDIESDSRLLRATFAECLFTGNPHECTIAARSGARYQFRFEKVVHLSGQILRPEDEIVVIGLICKIPDYAELTQRERQIVRLICRDMSNSEIASELKIKASTVETHRQNIRQKLNVKGTAGVVMYAVQSGLAAESRSSSSPGDYVDGV